MPKTLKIKFVGKNTPAPEFINDGSLKITLPKDQKRAFTHKDAKRILKLFPELYKKVVEKGKTAKKRKVARPSESGRFVSKQTAKDNPATTQTETI